MFLVSYTFDQLPTVSVESVSVDRGHAHGAIMVAPERNCSAQGKDVSIRFRCQRSVLRTADSAPVMK